MKKIYMYAHGGSGNHGCEAIVRSTVKILKEMGYEAPILISSNPEEDARYGVDQICEVIRDKEAYSKFSLDFIRAYYRLKIKNDFTPMDELAYKKTISQIKPGDIALSIGGDNYCYADVKKYIMLHNMMLRQGAKTVLWGCSVEPELLNNPEIAEDLSRYSLIVARESISYEVLKRVNSNTILISDPAFSLERRKLEGSESVLYKDYVGINLSPMVIDKEKVEGIVLKNYEILIQYIIEETDMNVILIPHVVWSDNDDREPLKELYEKFRQTRKIEILDDFSCEEIKDVISRCVYFVGARTHSTIAAYSSGIPTLVVGYSVKARGITKDILGVEDKYIISVQKVDSEEKLLNEFKNIMENKQDYLNRLVSYNAKKEQQIENLKKAMMLL